MLIKEINPIHFLYYRTRTTMSGLQDLAGKEVRSLYRDAAANDLFVSGPCYWCYFNFESIDKPFDLEICLPIAFLPETYNGPYKTKTTQSFRCLSHVHEGRWEAFIETYGLMMEEIHRQKLTLTNESREVYINIDMVNTGSNSTEIQLGIK